MGRFCTIVLILSAACGDNGPGPDQTVGGPGTATSNGNAPVTPRYYPEVCGLTSWTTVKTDPSSSVSVVSRPDGAAVLAVPSAGGEITGFAFDARMNVMGSQTGTTAALNQQLTSVSASVIGNRLVGTGVQAGSVFVDLLDNDLANAQAVTKVPGTFIAEPAIFNADGLRFMPVAGDTGLTLHQLDTQFQPITSKQIAVTKPATGMTAAQLGMSTIAVWSTASECYFTTIHTLANPQATRVEGACSHPRLATDPVDGTGALVFEGTDGVHLMRLAPPKVGGDAQLVRPGARAPRVVFDGARYWVSYVDPRGDVVVGFLDGPNHLVSMSLGVPLPQNDAYDMAIVDGSPMVFTLDSSGYSAHRMCMTNLW